MIKHSQEIIVSVGVVVVVSTIINPPTTYRHLLHGLEDGLDMESEGFGGLDTTILPHKTHEFAD